MTNIFTKDSLRQSVENASGGRNTIIYDSAGNPNYMVVVPKLDLAIYNQSGVTGTHKAFVYGDADDEVSEIFIGKYPASMLGTSVVSMPNQRPITSSDITSGDLYGKISTLKTNVSNKGINWHLTNAFEQNAYTMKYSIPNNKMSVDLPHAVYSETGGTRSVLFYSIINNNNLVYASDSNGISGLLTRLENINPDVPADELDEYVFYVRGTSEPVDEVTRGIDFLTKQYKLDEDSTDVVVWIQCSEQTLLKYNDVIVFKGKDSDTTAFEYHIDNFVPAYVGDNYSDDFESSADGTPYGMMGCYNLEYVDGLMLRTATDYRRLYSYEKNYNNNDIESLIETTEARVLLASTYGATLGADSETDATVSFDSTSKEYNSYNTLFSEFGPSTTLQAGDWSTIKNLMYSLGIVGTSFSDYSMDDNGEYPPLQNYAKNNIQFLLGETSGTDCYLFKDNIFSFRFAPIDHIMGIEQFSDTWEYFRGEDNTPWSPCTFRISYIPTS